MSSKKIIIIGAGPAGLTAGYEILRRSADHEVLILEETDTVGGISRTVEHNGCRMDIGGHRFFSKDERVNVMWRELMPLQGQPSFDDRKLDRRLVLPPGGPNPEKEDRVMLLRSRVSRIYYRRRFFDYPVKMNWNTIRGMGFATTLAAGASFLKASFKRLPETSLENFYINRFGRKLYSMFFEGYTEKLWGRHPRVISAEWGAQRVKGLSVAAVLKDIFSKCLPSVFRKKRKVETSLIEEFQYPKYGPGQLWGVAAGEFEKAGGKILFGYKAVKFKTDGPRITQVVCSHDGKVVTFDCDTVISSMPLKDLTAGLEGVPDDVRSIAEGLPYRDFVTVGLLTDRLNLKNRTKRRTLNGLVPDCWIYVQDPGVKLGRIQIFNNWSPYMVRDPEHSVWIGLEYFCAEGDELWSMDPASWKDFSVGELVRMGVLKENDPVRDFHVEKVKKAYPAYFDTYARIGELTAYLDTIGNLYCIGRNGQHRYNNMDHSMVTAFETADHILAGGKGSKERIWNVNTEQEYHEERHGRKDSVSRPG